MNFIQRLLQIRWFRRFALTSISLVTLYSLLYAWLNSSGSREWHATQAMLKAEGETIDFRAAVHDRIPEAENFCAIPLLKDLALVVDNDVNKGVPAEKRKRLEALKLPNESKGTPRPKFSNVALGTHADLKPWAEWLRKDGSFPMPADFAVEFAK